MDIHEIKNRLITEKKLDEVQVEKVLAKIDALSPDIREALEKWIETDTVESPEYAGYDVNAIIKAQPQMTALAAYLSLDWLRRDENTAKKAIEKNRHIIRNK